MKKKISIIFVLLFIISLSLFGCDKKRKDSSIIKTYNTQSVNKTSINDKTTSSIKNSTSKTTTTTTKKDTTTNIHTHVLELIEGRLATPFTDGVIEHYECSCGKYFDTNKNEITNIVIPKYEDALNKEYKFFSYADLGMSESEFNDSGITHVRSLDEYKDEFLEYISSEETSVKFNDGLIIINCDLFDDVIDSEYIDTNNGYLEVKAIRNLRIYFKDENNIELYFKEYDHTDEIIGLSSTTVNHILTNIIEGENESCLGTIDHYICEHCGYTFNTSREQKFSLLKDSQTNTYECNYSDVGKCIACHHPINKYGECNLCHEFVGFNLKSNTTNDFYVIDNKAYFKFETLCFENANIELQIYKNSYPLNPIKGIEIYEEGSDTNIVTPELIASSTSQYYYITKTEFNSDIHLKSYTKYVAVVSLDDSFTSDTINMGVYSFLREHEFDDEHPYDCVYCGYHCLHLNTDLDGYCKDCGENTYLDLYNGSISETITLRSKESKIIWIRTNGLADYAFKYSNNLIEVAVYDDYEALNQNYKSGEKIATTKEADGESWYNIYLYNPTDSDITFDIEYSCLNEHKDLDEDFICDHCFVLLPVNASFNNNDAPLESGKTSCYKITLKEGTFNVYITSETLIDFFFLYSEDGTYIDVFYGSDEIIGGKTYIFYFYGDYSFDGQVIFKCVEHSFIDHTCTVCGYMEQP